MKQAFAGFDDIPPDARWAVSTLTPVLHGEPFYKYFEHERDAIEYARRRVKSGPLIREGGKAYFVLGAQGVVYRVLRGMRGEERRSGAEAPESRREFLIVQRAQGTIPGSGKTRWVWDHGLSIEIPDIEADRERVRLSKGHKKLTRWDRHGDL